jgi:hypothetical protein
MSARSQIVLKKSVNNIFGTQSGVLQSAIKMKRKNKINLSDTVNINDINNINNNMKTIIDVNNNINSRLSETHEKTNDTPNDYYRRHRDRKLEYQKSYNRENDEKIKEYNKDYYLKRRAEILEKAKTRVICECGCDVQLSNMNAHKKTKKHLKRVGCLIDASTD